MPAPSCDTIADAPTPLDSVHGGAIDLAEVRWELNGPHGAPVVVLLGGISADEHAVSHAGNPAAGWWQEVLDAGAIDCSRFRTLGVGYVAARGAPTSSSDQARVIVAVLERLGIERVHAIVGGSYGGMVALALAQRFPTRVDRIVVLCAAHESHPMATAGRLLQRRVVSLGVETGRPREALAVARGIAITTYRSAHEFAGRFAGAARVEQDRVRFPVASYLEVQGERFARRFTAERFLALSESVDLHCVDPSSIGTPVTLVSVTSDTLVPTWQVAELHRQLPASTHHQIDSLYGHDAFLKEGAALAPIIRAALEGDAS